MRSALKPWPGKGCRRSREGTGARGRDHAEAHARLIREAPTGAQRSRARAEDEHSADGMPRRASRRVSLSMAKASSRAARPALLPVSRATAWPHVVAWWALVGLGQSSRRAHVRGEAWRPRAATSRRGETTAIVGSPTRGHVEATPTTARCLGHIAAAHWGSRPNRHFRWRRTRQHADGRAHRLAPADE